MAKRSLDLNRAKPQKLELDYLWLASSIASGAFCRRSKETKKLAKQAKKRPRVGEDLIEAAKEMVEHIKGKVALPVRYVETPDRVDVPAIRNRLGLSQAEFASSRTGSRDGAGPKARFARA